MPHNRNHPLNYVVNAASLICPVCREKLHRHDGSLDCAKHHTFDVARHGYVNFRGAGNGRTHPGDTQHMVASRAAFLSAGHYRELADLVAAKARDLLPANGVVLDAGGGTGYYLKEVLETTPRAHGILMDSSVPALRRAARIHPRAAAIGWDIWQPWPIANGSVDLLLNLFAPRNAGEFRRVLRTGGALIVVTPTESHLADVRRVAPLLGIDRRKMERLRTTLSTRFTEVGRERLTFGLHLTEQDVRHVIAMGPSAHHQVELAAECPLGNGRGALQVMASFSLTIHRPKPEQSSPRRTPRAGARRRELR